MREITLETLKTGGVLPESQPPVAPTSVVKFRVEAGETLENLIEPLPDPTSASSRFRKVGGFWLQNKTAPIASLADLNPGNPAPNPGDEIDVHFEHLRNVNVEGKALFYNFVGPGAKSCWYARPSNPLDLASKLHDLAYEINGLLFVGESRPEAAWSRLAKADYIFMRMIERIRHDQLDYAFIANIAECQFRADERYFRKGDRFINPIQALPKDWLMIPYDRLSTRPSMRVKARRKKHKSTQQTIVVPDYTALTLDDQIWPDRTVNPWRESVSDVMSLTILNEMEAIDDTTGRKKVRKTAWTKLISLKDME
ncbi:hypothetical protein [Cerasicoccus frondis]|uniref:hypothetical protein n=1 Tax=Cerasicoccus frondis TaxID=490090 RepID=UPI0028529C31|nr:hypothetical protein [Cerasicoccus frondis]